MKTINIWTRIEVIQKENSMVTKALKKVAASLKPKKSNNKTKKMVVLHIDGE